MPFYDLRQAFLVKKDCSCQNCVFIFNNMVDLYPLDESTRGREHLILTLIKEEAGVIFSEILL